MNDTTNPYEEGDVFATIRMGKISQLYDQNQREEYERIAEKSEEHWNTVLSPEERERVVDVINGAILRLFQRTDDWVPNSIRATGGDWLDISFRILLSDISEEAEPRTFPSQVEFLQNLADNAAKMLKIQEESADD